MDIIRLFGNEEPEKPAQQEQEPEERKSFFGRMRQAVGQAVGVDRMKEAVARTRESLSAKMEGIVALTRTVDANALDELESVLLTSDLGVQTTTQVLDALRERALRKDIEGGDHAFAFRNEDGEVVPIEVPPQRP